jgi:DNA polymerase III delta prime subunit
MAEWLWVEKYRPQKISECVLPQRLKHPFQEYVKSGSIPNLLLAGDAGVGKTTVAKALCKEIGVDYIFINSSEERGIDLLRGKIKQFASTMSFEGTKKVIILDEADYLTPEAQAALRGAIEEFSSNCTFILTCNYKKRLINAIHSRCTVIDFSLQEQERKEMRVEIFNRVKHILNSESIEFDQHVVAKIVKDFFPDFRRIINELQRFSSFGKIDKEVLNHFSDIQNLDVLIDSLKTKDFRKLRYWVAENKESDAVRFYRYIYDNLIDHIKPQTVPLLVILVAKYQYQHAFAADPELNVLALLTEIMIQCDFK